MHPYPFEVSKPFINTILLHKGDTLSSSMRLPTEKGVSAESVCCHSLEKAMACHSHGFLQEETSRTVHLDTPRCLITSLSVIALSVSNHFLCLMLINFGCFNVRGSWKPLILTAALCQKTHNLMLIKTSEDTYLGWAHILFFAGTIKSW